ncbi:O-antigen ligase family protein [Silvibacterium acidisoli]|uniref:O-antigen ligase family protein n=1 Tax=Acidobacteriaceae bacterium ZG23-2 TaxID=2883246 RepID=UPI00406BF0A5
MKMTIEELGCVAILLFFAVQGAIPFIAPNQALEMTNAPASGLTLYGGIASQILVNAGIALLLLLNLQGVTRRLGAMQWAGALAAVAVASTIWSQYPSISVRRSVPFALAGFFGLYLAVRFPLRRQLRLLWIAMIVLAIFSAVLAIAVPSVGLDSSPGHHMNWQGVFTQKNSCGRMMTLALALLLAERRLTFTRVASGILFVLVLLMSGSRSAWLAAAVLLSLAVWLWLAARLEARSRMLLIGASACFILAVALVAAAGYREIAEFLGRDATLSGRTNIWRQVFLAIRERPLLGWGYAAYWHGTQGAAFKTVVALHFIVFHAHNGFLEIWLETGLAGLSFWVLSYLRAWRRLLPVLCSGDIHQVVWIFYLLILMLFFNFDENALLTFNGLFWVLYVSAIANLELHRAERQTIPAFRVTFKPVAAGLS